MSGVITTGNHPKALWPGVRAWWGQKYAKHPQEWRQIFEAKDSTKAYEEDVEEIGFGLAPVKAQGASVAYDSHTQGPTTRYTHVVYGLGYIVTAEEIDDNQYRSKAFRRTEKLANSIRRTEETVAANVLNRAFNSSYAGGDGKELCATDHVTTDGTQSNELSTAADLSEAAIEDLIIQIMQATDSVGNQIALVPRKLIVAPHNSFEATRILKSTLQSGTANNDVNAIKAMGLLPEGVCINHYLTDPDAWWIKTDAPYGLTRFTRRGTSFDKDNDFDTGSAKAKATTRFSVGWSDWRGVYGSPGA